MRIKYMLLIGVLGIGQIQAKESNATKHQMVAMRMIGHEVLKSVGDSSSKVLPVQMKGERFQIQFESNFAFNPDDLTINIDSVIKAYEIAEHYIVEIENCGDDLAVYAYEFGIRKDSYIIPCRGRSYPNDCYEIYITIIDEFKYHPKKDTVFSPMQFSSTASGIEKKEEQKTGRMIWILPIIIGLGWVLFKRRKEKPISTDLLYIGKYQFDTKNMILQYEGENEELTGKETDLLALLYNSINETLEREKILKHVWGDEGDYVGRTLDVFISKLRKKLGRDSNIKIINIRGIGYKLVLNE